ncbi:MAG TPA: hypothetical protein VG165_02970 [Solirubrobacteraceae bacterium]|nr:hypothetical protein [Solirubrobacteraceae bacterium]
MDTQNTTTTPDKQVTVDVPEDRLAEFYAFYSRFLAIGGRSRHRGARRHGDQDRRGRHGGGHPGGGRGRRCGGRDDVTVTGEQGTVGTPAPPAADAEPVV